MVKDDETIFRIMDRYSINEIPFVLFAQIASYSAFDGFMYADKRNQQKKARMLENASKYHFSTIQKIACGGMSDTIEATEFYISIMNLLEDDSDRFLIFSIIDGFSIDEIMQEYCEKFGNVSRRNLYYKLTKAKKVIAKAYNIEM